MNKLQILLLLIAISVYTYASATDDNSGPSLSPTPPKISNIDIEIDSLDWSFEPVLIYGKLHFTMETSNANYIVLRMASNGYFFSFDAFNNKRPPFFGWAMGFDVDINDTKHVITTDFSDVCVFYTAFALNDYGASARGDTILINDYIKDPQILTSIMDYQAKYYTDVSTTITDELDLRFQYSDDSLLIIDGQNVVKNIFIYSLSGFLIHQQSGDDKRIDLHSFTPGIYILKCYTNSHCKTFKFIKR